MSEIKEDSPWIECRLVSCFNLFQKRVHNQSFCGRECCRIYTNARILAAYHSKKNKVTTGRVCKSKDCTTLLSRYNEDEYCSSCQQKQYKSKMEGWGWQLDEFGQRIA